MAAPSLQLIDQNKDFNDETQTFLVHQSGRHVGLNYHIVSVFGSQSTGKSTLLNALFGTSFGVMDEKLRSQTTKGIWIGRADPKVLDSSENGSGTSHEAKLGTSDSPPLFVLDVEGTDGRERGEDQDFERKAALFALASSEVLIVNMWEHQIGLYQGANMGLLKTVFEVNLSLFQTSGKAPRSRILFVIRDFIGNTPVESLAETLVADLNKHWATISKPAGLENSKISDFFDISFAALPHKILMSEKFTEAVGSLRTRFNDPDSPDYVFSPEYSRNIPLDGWPLYAKQIWTQIELNKDLDLPTQQILVARFRCQEIADTTWTAFLDALGQLNLPLGSNTIIPDFGKLLQPLRSTALESYDSQAAKYDKKVYATQRLELLGKVDALLSSHFRAQLGALQQKALATFRESALAKIQEGVVFPLAAEEAREKALLLFKEDAAASILDQSCYSFHPELDDLNAELVLAEDQLRAKEMARLVAGISKNVTKQLDLALRRTLKNPGPNTWQNILSDITTIVDKQIEKYENGKNFGLGGGTETNTKGVQQVQVAAWKAFDKKLADVIRADALIERMRDAFNDIFLYDSAGLPILWKNGDQIEGHFLKARSSALDILPVFSQALLPDGHQFERPFGVTTDEDVLDYQNLIPASEQEYITTKFRRDADNAFLSAKRSVAHTAVHIPIYIWAVIVVLGWNEFMAVLRNPLLVALLLLGGAGAYILYSLNLFGPAASVAEATFVRARDVAKDRLREYLLNEPNSTGSIAEPELIEMREKPQGESASIASRESTDNILHHSQSDSAAVGRHRHSSSVSSDALNKAQTESDLKTDHKIPAALRRSSSIEATPLPANTNTNGPHPVTMRTNVKIAASQRRTPVEENVLFFE